MKADETVKKQREDEEVLEMRLLGFRKKQQAEMNGLLQKIQKDRNDQIKQRQVDS